MHSLIPLPLYRVPKRRIELCHWLYDSNAGLGCTLPWDQTTVLSFQKGYIHLHTLHTALKNIPLPKVRYSSLVLHPSKKVLTMTGISKMPLFLEDDKNFRRFLIGVSMLNYNIVYLCFTQGIHIPLSQVANTLQNLMAGCNAPGLGL